MNSILRSTIKVLLSGIGVLIGVFVLLLSLTAIQGMSGREQFVGLLFFFSISFAIAFGLGAACAISLTGRYKAWPTARAFASGGAVGGAFLAIGMKTIFYFEQQLRVLTSGRPLSVFLLAAILGAIAIALFVGTALLRRHYTGSQ